MQHLLPAAPWNVRPIDGVPASDHKHRRARYQSDEQVSGNTWLASYQRSRKYPDPWLLHNARSVFQTPASAVRSHSALPCIPFQIQSSTTSLNYLNCANWLGSTHDLSRLARCSFLVVPGTTTGGK